jgi:uncharacterized protein (TIGR00661 family)
MPEYEFHIFTFGKAYEFLKTIKYQNRHNIAGILFSYRHNHVNYLKTGLTTYNFFKHEIKKNLDYIKTKADELNPCLFMTDFEPSMPRVANLLNKKFISVDNQHRFLDCDLSDLPAFLKLYCRMAKLTVEYMVPNPYKTIISTFNFDNLTPNNPNVSLTYGLLRKGMDQITPSNKGFVLVYLRGTVSDIILDSLRNLNIPLHVYGHIDNKNKNYFFDKENFSFHGLSPFFIKDLANCQCVISTAGNQLITEARFYNKPMLVVPEPGQYEQHINAFYVDKLKIGQSCSASKLNEKVVINFVNNFKPSESKMVNGVQKVINIVNENT